ncbi:putative aminoglycoside phosphotransferase [Planococcus sp. PAMC 21323]|uniref:phosphotransferase family protein n=1 Tax=Planococcus sp. PAMC 21323 TaxID=1526927 RepID=UPI0005701569|nr:phosphotransferase family protein [Planococcus sp. PAMC 21323]AIY04798.1 putative aminoglycoside phosphotransferase [Planococcus sp. PAMC 21323]
MEKHQNGIISVRAGEELNKQRLEQFLRQEINGLPKEQLVVRQFGTGHSNLTYALQIGDWDAVLRRPPLGPVAPRAHDMEREYKILSALHPLFNTAPKPFVFSDDLSIVGSPFFVMERRYGFVLDSDFPEGVNPTPELGRKISEKMVELLVELHSLDYQKTDLADMAKPQGFMQRQVEGWIGRYERAQTDQLTGVKQLMEWLQGNIPISQEPAIIHYDFKLNNALFSADFSEITGLFDWEMTTVGDPLADLGAAMSYWIQSDDPKLLKEGLGKAPVTVMDGFYSREEFIASYSEKSGRDVSDMNFYLTFAYFKLAVIVQQIYYRYKKGQTQDPRFAHFDQYVASLMAHALSTALKG